MRTTFLFIGRAHFEMKMTIIIVHTPHIKFFHYSIQFPGSVVPFQESDLTLIPQYQESSQYRHKTGRYSR